MFFRSRTQVSMQFFQRSNVMFQRINAFMIINTEPSDGLSAIEKSMPFGSFSESLANPFCTDHICLAEAGENVVGNESVSDVSVPVTEKVRESYSTQSSTSAVPELPCLSIDNGNGAFVQSLTFVEDPVSRSVSLLEDNQPEGQPFFDCSQVGTHHWGPENYLQQNKQQVCGVSGCVRRFWAL